MDNESREFEVRDELRAKRKNIKSFDDLVEFLKEVHNHNTGYGVAPRAIAQAALAVAWYFASEFGITGFQAGFVMWDFIRDWNRTGNKTGLKLIDYDDMLYPQYDHKFEKTIKRDTWVSIQKEAKKRLEEGGKVHPDVAKHWQSIVDGIPPFGYTIED